MATPILEIPIDSVESAMAAQEGGAARVELCADLNAGGATPSAGMIVAVRKAVNIGVHVMIRPRGGDFIYSDAEFEVMKRDIVAAKQFGADGVVFGVLTEAFAVDMVRMQSLIALARPISVTFHRAFDCVRDPSTALNEIIGLGIERILTSGQQHTAEEGIPLLRQIIEDASGKIIIMPACGISKDNVKKILSETGAREIHVGNSLTRTIGSPEGGLFAMQRSVVDKNKVSELIRQMY